MTRFERKLKSYRIKRDAINNKKYNKGCKNSRKLNRRERRRKILKEYNILRRQCITTASNYYNYYSTTVIQHRNKISCRHIAIRLLSIKNKNLNVDISSGKEDRFHYIKYMVTIRW